MSVGYNVKISDTTEQPSTLSRGKTLYVGGTGDGNYTKIQDAINDTIDGDTVFVYNGTYYENVVVDKSIQLIGEDKNTTIIDGGGNDDVVHVSADNVKISGFTIQNSSNFVGIKINSNYNCISNNIFTNNGCGIAFYSSSNNIIIENTFTNELADIFIYKRSSNITIVDNSFLSGGIFISSVNLNGWNTHTIQNNSINDGKIYYYKNNHVGATIPSDAVQIILANCSNFVIQNHNISNVGVAIQLGFSFHNTILRNTLNHTYIAFYTESSSNNNISLNTINDNEYGIAMVFASSKGNSIYGNSLTNNEHGIYLWRGITSNIHDKLLKKYICGWKLFERRSDNTITSGDSSNNIISSNTITDNYYGIEILGLPFNNNIIIRNNITNSYIGVLVSLSSYSNITRNNIVASIDNGILLDYYCENNIISRNTITNNHRGIYVHSHSNDNIFYHNNFINNIQHAYDECTNIWDDGKYGNYWDDYKERYPFARKIWLKGIWNIPYEIPGGSNKDRCPLIKQWPYSKSRTIPRNTAPYSSYLLKLLEQFPILQTLLQRLGLQ